MDYVLFERSGIVGSFSAKYPIHRRLISINKQYTGKGNPQFNQRHDWNALLTDKPGLETFANYSTSYWPHADDLVRYLDDFTKAENINVQYSTEITTIEKVNEKFTLEDARGNVYNCDKVIVATGIASPKIPDITGAELIER